MASYNLDPDENNRPTFKVNPAKFKIVTESMRDPAIQKEIYKALSNIQKEVDEHECIKQLLVEEVKFCLELLLEKAWLEREWE